MSDPKPPLPSPAEKDAVSLLDNLVNNAVRLGASDIHLEPKEKYWLVRLRVDGNMVENGTIAPDVAVQVVSRIKVLARLDISERRVPQDGQLTLDLYANKRVSLRASTFPALHGEKVVVRILIGKNLVGLESLGMDQASQDTVKQLVTRPQGFIVTTGPTGSGKTSTLYSFLQLVDTKSNNVVTLEDPVEVDIPSVIQGQANPRAGFTFASGLRAILRQDPDVIMVGEIRDSETAGIALQAALTGHLVLSTLHTADTIETIVRLVDLGTEPWIVASALTAVIAQRLVRVACENCKEFAILEHDFYDGDEKLLEKGAQTVRSKGCMACNKSGYRGRTGIYQILIVDDDMRELIKVKANHREYRARLKALNVHSLRRAGFAKVLAGQTTVDEVLRVTI